MYIQVSQSVLYSEVPLAHAQAQLYDCACMCYTLTASSNVDGSSDSVADGDQLWYWNIEHPTQNITCSSETNEVFITAGNTMSLMSLCNLEPGSTDRKNVHEYEIILCTIQCDINSRLKKI